MGEHRCEKTIEGKEHDGGAASRREALATIGPAGARAARSPFYGLCLRPGATTIGEHRNEKTIHRRGRVPTAGGEGETPGDGGAMGRWGARRRLALATGAMPTTPFNRTLPQRERNHHRPALATGASSSSLFNRVLLRREGAHRRSAHGLFNSPEATKAGRDLIEALARGRQEGIEGKRESGQEGERQTSEGVSRCEPTAGMGQTSDLEGGREGAAPADRACLQKLSASARERRRQCR